MSMLSDNFDENCRDTEEEWPPPDWRLQILRFPPWLSGAEG